MHAGPEPATRSSRDTLPGGSPSREGSASGAAGQQQTGSLRWRGQVASTRDRAHPNEHVLKDPGLNASAQLIFGRRAEGPLRR